MKPLHRSSAFAIPLLILATSSVALGQMQELWVDFSYPSVEDGSAVKPFDTLAEALSFLNSGGTVHLAAGNSHETLTISTPMTLSASSGPVRIGDLNASTGSGTPYEALRITEIMYHPVAGAAEYLELQNAGSTVLNLSGVYFSAGVTYTFPGNTNVAAGAYLVLVRDTDATAFSTLYSDITIGGVYAGGLANGGETISINDPSDNIFLSLTYNDVFPWPTGADGLGFSLVAKNPAYPISDSSNWRTSTDLGGSPGSSEINPNIPLILVNEALTHTDLPDVDAVELYNASNSSIDIRGWFVTDDPLQPFKAKVPDNAEFSAIASGGYAVLYESDFFDSPGTVSGQALPGFQLSSHGESVYLFSANASEQLTGYVHGFDFGGAENGISFGRVTTTDGRESFVAQISETLGATNSGARIGPLVISELHYNPLPNGVEYVEVLNTSGSTVSLWDTSSGGDTSNTYRIAGIGYSFPASTTIGAGARVLVVDIEPDDYILEFGDPGFPVYGPFGNEPALTGDSLSNGGETVRVQWPDTPDEVSAGVFVAPYIDMETVRYNDIAPWPDADNNGNSLARSNTAGFGSEPTYWTAGTPTHQPGQGVAALAFSTPRGFYTGTVNLTISTATSGALIIYTTDGSAPSDTNGLVYSSAISIPTNNVFRARGFKAGFLDSATQTHTYIMNSDAATLSLPAVSIVGNPGESIYEPNGVMAIVGGEYVPQDDWYTVWQEVNGSDYNNPIKRGIAYERPVSFELIYPGDNSGTQEDCGIRVQGSDWHRARYFRASDWTGCTADDLNYAKFSFRLAFRKEYGARDLDFPIFPNMPITSKYDQIVLRGGHNDTCDPFVKDELTRRLHADMGALATTGNNAHLFINGEYKGFYNPVARLDESFFKEQLASNESWDVITPGSTVRDGDDIAWNTLLTFAQTEDLSVQAKYDEMAAMIDVDAFIDYLILELFTNNADWPNINWISARETSSIGKWRFYVWDSEFAFRPTYLNRIAFDEYPQNRGAGLNGEETEIAWIYRALRQNSQFDARFDQRIKVHLFGAGALAPTNLAARFNELKDEMSLAIPAMGTHITGDFLTYRYPVFLIACQEQGLYTP